MVIAMRSSQKKRGCLLLSAKLTDDCSIEALHRVVNDPMAPWRAKLSDELITRGIADEDDFIGTLARGRECLMQPFLLLRAEQVRQMYELDVVDDVKDGGLRPCSRALDGRVEIRKKENGARVLFDQGLSDVPFALQIAAPRIGLIMALQHLTYRHQTFTIMMLQLSLQHP